MAGRWIINNSQILNDNGQLSLTFRTQSTSQKVELVSPSFIHFVEGESKLIYQVKSKIKEVTQYFEDRVWIILKSTIYSHTQQHTGEIEHLG
jgi:hypothetical protein